MTFVYNESTCITSMVSTCSACEEILSDLKLCNTINVKLESGFSRTRYCQVRMLGDGSTF